MSSQQTGITESKYVKWTEEEDDILRRAIDQYGEKRWTLISQHLTRRTSHNCRNRWFRAINPRLIKGMWTVEEDEKLIQFVKENGINWAKCSKIIHGRTGLRCKDRWFNVVRPDIKRD